MLRRQLLLSAASLLALILPCAAAPPEISADGHEVTDPATGLIWRRCSEGMLWDGAICAGQAQRFTHAAALVQAQTASAQSCKAWRVTSRGELHSLLVLLDHKPGASPQPSSVFPQTPPSPFWSATIYNTSSNGQRAKYLHFSNATEYDDYRSASSFLRLVRSGR